MEKQEKVVDSAQGADTQEVQVPQVKEWLKRDLSLALHVLEAVYSDPDLMDQVAVFMAGRIQNAKNRKAQAPLPSQPVH